MAQQPTTAHAQTIPRTLTHSGVNVREDIAFTNHKGEEKNRFRKRAEKALQNLQEILPRVLERDEVILYVARGNRPVGLLEQLTLGWLAQVLAGVILVFTNNRLLYLRIKSNGTWRGSLRAVAWGDIESIQVKGWLGRYMDLKYRNGTKERYWAINSADSRKLKTLLPELLTANQGKMTTDAGPVSLCPKCLASLTRGVYECASCKLVLRNERTLLWRTIFIPGGAYFYTKNPLVAAVTLVGESFLLLVIVLLVAEATGLLPLDPDNTRTDAVNAAVLFIALYTIETMIAFFHGRKFIREFIPAI